MTRNLRSLKRLDRKIVRIVRDILRRSGDACFRIKGDPSLRLKKQKSSRLVRGIIRNAYTVTIFNIIQALLLASIDAERLIVDLARVHQMGTLLFVEGIQIIDVLEIIRIHLAGLNDLVRKDIISENLDLQFIPLFLQQRLRLLQNLRMGIRRGCYRDLLKVIRENAHRKRTQNKRTCEQSCNNLFFHNLPPPVSVLFVTGTMIPHPSQSG